MTMIELPSDVIQRLQSRATALGLSVGATIDYLLGGEASQARNQPSHTPLPPPVALRGGYKLNIDDIESAIGEGRD